MTLHVGYAQDTITPALDRPVYLAGFGQNRRAESVHDDLYARALALIHGQTRVVAVALDLIGLGRQQCQEIEGRIRDTVPNARLWLSCTHTHHGADTIGLWGPDKTTSGVDPEYMVELKEKIVTTALAALDRTQPALMRTISIPVTGLAKNARDPEILDEELACLQFCRARAEEGCAPLANWLIYPCHPEVLWEQNPHITSDYVGAMRRAVEVGTSAPCVGSVGAIGGMMTPDVEEHSFAEADHMGQTLARTGLEALLDKPPAPVEVLAYTRSEFTMPMANPLFRMAMEGGLLPNLLNNDGTITTEANMLRIGPAWLFGVPGELLPKLGLAFKAKMRQAGAEVAAIVGLTNDELGYILPEEVFLYPDDPFEPGEHYEETMSIGPEAGPRLEAALLDLLAK
jgi:hypothetical protein